MEGFVILMKSFNKNKHFAAKWKSVMEPQGNNPDKLKQAIHFLTHDSLILTLMQNDTFAAQTYRNLLTLLQDL